MHNCQTDPSRERQASARSLLRELKQAKRLGIPTLVFQQVLSRVVRRLADPQSWLKQKADGGRRAPTGRRIHPKDLVKGRRGCAGDRDNGQLLDQDLRSRLTPDASMRRRDIALHPGLGGTRTSGRYAGQDKSVYRPLPHIAAIRYHDWSWKRRFRGRSRTPWIWQYRSATRQRQLLSSRSGQGSSC